MHHGETYIMKYVIDIKTMAVAVLIETLLADK